MRLARNWRAGSVAFSGESGCGHDVSGTTNCGCGTFHMPPVTNFRVAAAENNNPQLTELQPLSDLSSAFSLGTAGSSRLDPASIIEFLSNTFAAEPYGGRFDSDSIATPESRDSLPRHRRKANRRDDKYPNTPYEYLCPRSEKKPRRVHNPGLHHCTLHFDARVDGKERLMPENLETLATLP